MSAPGSLPDLGLSPGDPAPSASMVGRPLRSGGARKAIDVLLRDLDSLTVVAGNAARAWSRLTFDDRREIGRRWPQLANALIAAEQHDGAP